MNEVQAAKFDSVFRECDAHVARLRSASAKLSAVFPLGEERFSALENATVETLDQFVYRFTKLQDALAARMMPAFRVLLSGSDAPCPFLDTLHDLEKAGIVPSARGWQELRALRNNLAHDYPESVSQTVATLNEVFKRWEELAEVLFAARKFYAENVKK
jgi:hypothetical protein